jgi:hypothetical protein
MSIRITILPILILLFSLPRYLAAATAFGPEQVITTNAGHADRVFAADLDGDGDLDALSASSGDDKIAWYPNTDGLGTFGGQQIITNLADGCRCVYAADIDGDGDLDVLSASNADDKIAWYENIDGSGTFGAQIVITLLADKARWVDAADLDGDGDIDVLSASYADDKIAWYENTDGLGTFGDQLVITTSANGANMVQAVDVDGDGDLDVISSSHNDDKIAWYQNSDGLGTFGVQLIISSDVRDATSFYAADIDGDGDQDVISTGEYYGHVAWHENSDGLGTFAEKQLIYNSSDVRSVHAADIDIDGDRDVFSGTFYGSSIDWAENTDAQGAFGPKTNISTNEVLWITSVFAADLDGDGDPDILVSGELLKEISWYENIQTSQCQIDSECQLCNKCIAGDCVFQSPSEDLKDECTDSDPCLTGNCDGGGHCGFSTSGTLCLDEFFCNGPESCDGAGNCLPTLDFDCNDFIACTQDSCDEDLDLCSNLPEDSLCDNQEWCDGDESCNPGQGCQAGTPRDCTDSVGCTIDSCSEDTDQCEHSPNHSSCSDGLFCNGTEVCDLESDCQPDTQEPCLAPTVCSETLDTCIGCTTDLDCDDEIACTHDTCDPDLNECTHQPDDSSCDNGLWCDGTEVCHPTLGCQSGSPPDCNDLVGCTIDFCNDSDDQCDHQSIDFICDDNMYCNGNETCDPEQGCLAGTPVNCDDGVACTQDTCNDDFEQCEHTIDNSLCDNGLWCDGQEICDLSLGCQAGTPQDCDDSVDCTEDACNESFDQCDNQTNHLACNDGLFCNGAESCNRDEGCQQGEGDPCQQPTTCSETSDSCIGCAADEHCDDGIACTQDSCDMNTFSCVFTSNDTNCDDGAWCNGVEICSLSSGCLPGIPIDCSDQIGCTLDNCNETDDQCENIPQDSLCSDGLWCNGQESCDSSNGCIPGTTIDCDDGIACTQDSCNESIDLCQNLSDNSLCSDNDWCNGLEVCDQTLGCQAGSPPECDDGSDCTIDTCDSAQGSCVYEKKDACCHLDSDCDDGNPCSRGICSEDRRCRFRPTDCNTGGPCGSDNMCIYGYIHLNKGDKSPTGVNVNTQIVKPVLQFKISTEGMGGTLNRLRLAWIGSSEIGNGLRILAELYVDKDSNGLKDPNSAPLQEAITVDLANKEIVFEDLGHNLDSASEQTYLVALKLESEPNANQAGLIRPMNLFGLSLTLLLVIITLTLSWFRYKGLVLQAFFIVAFLFCISCGKSDKPAWKQSQATLSLVNNNDITVVCPPDEYVWIKGVPISGEVFSISL